MRKNRFRSNRKRKFENDVPQDLGTVELEITDVAFGGKGLAKKDGKVFFVKNALPTETVLCRLEKRKEKILQRGSQKNYNTFCCKDGSRLPSFRYLRWMSVARC